MECLPSKLTSNRTFFCCSTASILSWLCVPGSHQEGSCCVFVYHTTPGCASPCPVHIYDLICKQLYVCLAWMQSEHVVIVSVTVVLLARFMLISSTRRQA
ncbi:hypothetical protein VPH35_119074 [Triticum aestivum]